MAPLKMPQGQQQQKVLLLVGEAVVVAPVAAAPELHELAGAWKLVLVWMLIQRYYLLGEQIEIEGLAGEEQKEQAPLELVVVEEPSFYIFFQLAHPLTSHLLLLQMTTLFHPLKQCHLRFVPCVGRFLHP